MPHQHRAAAPAKQRHFALDGAIEMLGFNVDPTIRPGSSRVNPTAADSAESMSPALCSFPTSDAAEPPTPHCGYHETNTALVLGHAAGVDSAGSEGPHISADKTESTELRFGARDLEEDVDDQNAAKPKTVRSPPKAAAGVTTVGSSEWLRPGRDGKVRAAETETRTRRLVSGRGHGNGAGGSATRTVRAGAEEAGGVDGVPQIEDDAAAGGAGRTGSSVAVKKAGGGHGRDRGRRIRHSGGRKRRGNGDWLNEVGSEAAVSTSGDVRRRPATQVGPCRTRSYMPSSRRPLKGRGGVTAFVSLMVGGPSGARW